MAADATAAAIEAARGVVQMDGPIPPGTPIGRLSDIEWGWIVAAILFAWISVRADRRPQSNWTQSDYPTDRPRSPTMGRRRCGGNFARVRGACPDIDWSKPLAEWLRETMIGFLLKAMPLIRKAMIARDLSAKGVTRKSSANMVARQANAAAGGPSMTPDEFDDEIAL